MTPEEHAVIEAAYHVSGMADSDGLGEALHRLDDALAAHDRATKTVVEWAADLEKALEEPVGVPFRPADLVERANAYALLALAGAIERLTGYLERES